MALIKCPECDLQVSNKAKFCPHCGYPIQETPAQTKKAQTKNKHRHMRLPNGFGSVTELKGRNLRKPFWARVTVGKTPEGKPILKSLKPVSMFATYNEAYKALMKYNENPYDLCSDITWQELYEKWLSERILGKKSVAYIRCIKSAWSYYVSLYDVRFSDIRTKHLRSCINDGYRIETKGVHKGKRIYPTANIKKLMKNLANLLFQYAIEYELTDTNYASKFKLSDDVTADLQKVQKEHICFSDDEVKTLWSHVDSVEHVDWLLIQIYMGWRPQELVSLKLNDINLDEWYAQSGMKTAAGKNRIVPIHSKIRSIVQRNYDMAVSNGCEYLFCNRDKKETYNSYRRIFSELITELHLNPEHRPHDARKTFITNAKRVGMDEYSLKLIVGHAVQDITEATYTVRDVEWLRRDIEKLI